MMLDVELELARSGTMRMQHDALAGKPSKRNKYTII